MTVVARRRPVQPWVNGKVKISAHAVERAWERMREKYQGVTWERVCKILERVVRHPEGEVFPMDRINDGKFQVALAVMEKGTGEVLGYLAVASDTKRAGVVATTWLETWMVEGMRERLRRQQFEIRVPRWWHAWSCNPDEPGFGVDKSEQTG